jgi:DNA-binding HxlR family transcriptional regulator
MMENSRVCDPVFSQVDALLRLLTKSKLLHILYILHQKKRSMRFTELKQNIGSSSTTLTRRLNELLSNGLIHRNQEKEEQGSISYELSDDGHALAPSIQSMYDWIVEREITFHSTL